MALLRNDGTIERRSEVRIRPELVRPLATVRREHIESALILCGGNRKLAAKRLKVSYRTLMRWIDEFRNEDFDA